MTSRLSVVLASRVAARGAGGGGSGGGRARASALACAPQLLARGPDRPDIPSRHPDIWPPGNPMPDSNVPDPMNPDPDMYPPDIGVPRRDSDVVPPRYPSPDIYPPADTPDMPEPPVPGKGPFMAQHFGWGAAAPAAMPQDSPKCPSVLCASWPAAPAAHSGSALGRRSGASGGFAALAPPLLLLKTDGGNPWMEAGSAGLHSAAASAYTATRASGGGAGRSLSEEEQEAANRTRAAMEGSQKQADAGTLPSDSPDATSAGPPRDSLPGFSQAAEPMSHIGKIGDDLGDVPEATGTRSVKPKVGPKASPGTPLEVPVEVPKPGFPK